MTKIGQGVSGQIYKIWQSTCISAPWQPRLELLQTRDGNNLYNWNSTTGQ